MRTLAIATMLLGAVSFATAATPSGAAAAEGGRASAPRVTTGVTAPVIVETVPVSISDSSDAAFFVGKATIQVSFLLNAEGHPENIKVLNSSSPALNRDVEAALKKFQFRAGMLDQQAVAVPMKLSIIVTR